MLYGTGWAGGAVLAAFFISSNLVSRAVGRRHRGRPRSQGRTARSLAGLCQRRPCRAGRGGSVLRSPARHLAGDRQPRGGRGRHLGHLDRRPKPGTAATALVRPPGAGGHQRRSYSGRLRGCFRRGCDRGRHRGAFHWAVTLPRRNADRFRWNVGGFSTRRGLARSLLLLPLRPAQRMASPSMWRRYGTKGRTGVVEQRRSELPGNRICRGSRLGGVAVA